MPVVLVPTAYRGPTRGESRIEVPGETIAACLDAVEERYPGFRELVIEPGGRVHRFVKVTLNGELLGYEPGLLDQPIVDADEIEVLAAIAGG